MPSASLSHYAPLSFVVIGRRLQIASRACSSRNSLIRELVNFAEIFQIAAGKPLPQEVKDDLEGTRLRKSFGAARRAQLSYCSFFLYQFLEIIGPEPPLLCHPDEAYILWPFAKQQRGLGVRGHRIIT
jgi:hypothetical protein